MEEFFAKYGVANEQQFFGKVAGDSIFAMRVASDFFEEKFPRPAVEEAFAIHPDHPDAPAPRVAVSQAELIAQSYPPETSEEVEEPAVGEQEHAEEHHE